eukprot:1384723-Amorphochlora_amoeboformis.AAC.2
MESLWRLSCMSELITGMRERSKRAISPGKSQVVSPNSNWTKSASRGGGKDKEYGAESEGGSYSEHLLAIL